MKASTLLIFGALAAAAYYFANLGVAGETITFVANGIHFDGISTVTVNLLAQNVSNADLVVSSMTGVVTVNGTQIATVSDFTTRSIPANSQVNIPVIVRVSLGALPGIISMLMNNSGPVDVIVSGNTNVNGLVIPFTTEEDLSLS